MIGDFPKSIFELLQQQIAQTGRMGATRVFVTPQVQPMTVGGGAQSAPVPVRFNEKGWALALYGQEGNLATPASFAQTAVRFQIGGTEDFFVDGQGGPSAGSFLSLFGGVNNWFPLLRRVVPGVDWIFTFQNNSPVGAPLTLSPSVEIAVIADADVAEMIKQQAIRNQQAAQP
jgi:hypothetical protein